MDTDNDGTAEVNGDDFVQREYYTNAWQRVEVRPKGSTSSDSSTNGLCLYVYGVRYVDDMAHRRRDTDDSGAVDEQFYSLSDANYDVVTVVNEDGEGIERVYYSAYGVPECFPFGDADYDYTVEASDANVGGGYSILKDINLDGAANQTDADLGAAYLGFTGGLGELTSVDGGETRGNEVGYAGYLWADERSQWHVRHRELSPRMGRWLQRDPMQYIDDLNIYGYVSDQPIAYTDHTGFGKSKLHRRRRTPLSVPSFIQRRTCDSPCPSGQEKTVIIVGDIRSILLAPYQWQQVFSGYEDDYNNKGHNVEVYRNGVSREKLQEIMSDPCVKNLVIIAHSADDGDQRHDDGSPDEYPGFWSSPDDFITPSDITQWMGDCDDLESVILHSCNQGTPGNLEDWKKAFNLPEYRFWAPDYDEKPIYYQLFGRRCFILPEKRPPTSDPELPQTLPEPSEPDSLDNPSPHDLPELFPSQDWP